MVEKTPAKDHSTNDYYRELVDLLNKYSDSYYNHNKSLVSDQKFDILYRELVSLEKQHPEWVLPNSPTKRVGAEPPPEFEKKAHVYKMYSLDKAFIPADLTAFHTRCLNVAKNTNIKLSYYVDSKIDGLSCDLFYKQGKLVLALTRGDGKIGEDVTANAYRIQNIPQRITSTMPTYVHGEIVVHKADFHIVNREREKQGLPTFSNLRDYASESLRQRNPDVTAQRHLRFYAWRYMVPGQPMTYEHQAEMLSCHGFSLPKAKVCYDPKDIMSYITTVAKERSFFTYEVDGMVIKVNHPEIRKLLGENEHDPNWAIAWKFESSGYSSVVTEIAWKATRNNVLLPVLKIHPVYMNGVRYDTLILNNVQTLLRLNAGVGAKVKISRHGGMIPKITEVITPGAEIVLPGICPFCGQQLTKSDTDLLCTNDDCPEVFAAWLKYMVSKDCLDVKGISDTFIREAISSKTISKFEDLFNLVDNKSELLKTDDLVTLITRFRNVNLFEAFMCLNIPGMGRAMASKLAMTVGSLPKLVERLENDKELDFLTLSSSIKQELRNWYQVPAHVKRLKFLVGLQLRHLKK